LDVAYPVAEVWPEPPDPKLLHVIVELPSGERCFSSYINPRSFLRRRGVRDVDGQPLHKRARLDPAIPAWLKELHSKTWGRGVELKATLFRKAVVTRKHYDTLQNILNQKYPGRNTKEYDGRGHNVTSDKLYVLEKIALAGPDLDLPEAIDLDDDLEAISGDDGLEASSDDDSQEASSDDDSQEASSDDDSQEASSDDDSQEASSDDNGLKASNDDDGQEPSNDDDGPEPSNEDDSEINSSFPFTLRYLDLSSLELESAQDRFPLPLYRREEYRHIPWLIGASPNSGVGSIIVNGQPGTGEVLVSLSHRI